MTSYEVDVLELGGRAAVEMYLENRSRSEPPNVLLEDRGSTVRNRFRLAAIRRREAEQ